MLLKKHASWFIEFGCSPKYRRGKKGFCRGRQASGLHSNIWDSCFFIELVRIWENLLFLLNSWRSISIAEYYWLFLYLCVLCVSRLRRLRIRRRTQSGREVRLGVWCWRPHSWSRSLGAHAWHPLQSNRSGCLRFFLTASPHQHSICVWGWRSTLGRMRCRVRYT